MAATRALTKAQKEHIRQLNLELAEAQANLNRFIAYLREEYETPAGEWLLRDLNVGFEEVVQREE